MNSLIYRSCHNGVIESGDYWNQQGLEHQSCTRSSTELFDSTADLNTSRSTKDETFSRLAFLVAAKKGRPFKKKNKSQKMSDRDATSSMFNGPCQLHGSAGFISACAVDADDALLTPTGSSSRYVNSSVVTGITSTSAMHAGLRPRSGPPPLSDLPQPCSADRCLMSPGLTCPDVYMALEGVQFLAEHTRREQYTIRVYINQHIIF